MSGWARAVSWLDDNVNHRRGTYDDSARVMPSGAAYIGPRTRWRWFCDYNDRLITGEWLKAMRPEA